MYKTIFLSDLETYLKLKNISSKVNATYSDFEDYQYQSSLTLVNKNINKDDLINFLKEKDYYEEIKITGPGFISVKFKLFNGINSQKQNKKIVVDYCGVNVAKKMHIGHIRSMFIGDYIVRLHENLGDQVIKINHIGDWGNQFGYLLNYIKINKLENDLTNELLTKYYKEANLLNKSDNQFKEDSEVIAHKLQNELDPEITKLWEKCVNLSMADAVNTFKKLNIKMTLNDTQGESFYSKKCNELIKDLIQKGIATKSEDNSTVIFFDKFSPLVIQKSNGNFLYPVYDLAALKWRQENLNPDKIIYVVDKRQELHFKQVFEVAKKAGYVKENVILEHVGFGTILGKDKKPLKTKEGDSLYLDDLLIDGENILSNSDYFQKLEPEIKEVVLEKSIIGGMKFYDLKFNKSQDYIFDWKFVLNFSGGSAPYIQNAIIRIDSIFYKLGLEPRQFNTLNFNNNWDKDEKEIIFQIQKNKEIIKDSTEEYNSQTLCENIIKLCQLFHKYYEKEQIIGHTEQNKKLELLGFTYNSLIENINILGIESYPCKQKLLLKLKPQ